MASPMFASNEKRLGRHHGATGNHWPFSDAKRWRNFNAMSEMFNPIDAHCLSAFPELLEQFSEAELRSASSIGSYIFHEDYFMKFVETQSNNELLLRRVATYIEYLASHENQYQRDLVEVGILERLVSEQDHRIAPFLGPAGAAAVIRVLPNFYWDPEPWFNALKRK